VKHNFIHVNIVLYMDLGMLCLFVCLHNVVLQTK